MTLTLPFTAPVPGSLPPADELQRLHDVNDHLNDLIPALVEQKGIILRRINILQSTTRVLPPEALAMIFLHACKLTSLEHARSDRYQGKPYFDHFLLSLAAVSSLWRQIIFSTPELWTNLCMRFNDVPIEGYLNLLRLYFTNSGILKLDIKIDFYIPKHSYNPTRPDFWPNADTLIHSSIDDIIVDNLHRIHSLHLDKASPRWLRHAPGLTELVSFAFSSNRPISGSSGLPSSIPGANIIGPGVTIVPLNSLTRHPSHPLASFASRYLQRLTMTGGTCIELKDGPHWSAITHLELREVGRSTCIELLALCSNVEEYICSPIPDEFQDHQIDGLGLNLREFWSSPVTRPPLSVFAWEGMRRVNDIEQLMFKNLHLPSIQKLRITASLSSGRRQSIFEFCKRLPPSISTVALTLTCGVDESQEECLLRSLSHILEAEELEISFIGNEHAANHTLTYFADPDFFPKAKRFKLLGLPVPLQWPWNPQDINGKRKLHLQAPAGELIAQGIRRRALEKLVEGLIIEVVEITVDWTPEEQEELSAIEEATGREFIIFEDD